MNGYARSRTERLTELAEKAGDNLRSIAGAQRNNGDVLSHTTAESSVVVAAGIEPASDDPQSPRLTPRRRKDRRGK